MLTSDRLFAVEYMNKLETAVTSVTFFKEVSPSLSNVHHPSVSFNTFGEIPRLALVSLLVPCAWWSDAGFLHNAHWVRG